MASTWQSVGWNYKSAKKLSRLLESIRIKLFLLYPYTSIPIHRCFCFACKKIIIWSQYANFIIYQQVDIQKLQNYPNHIHDVSKLNRRWIDREFYLTRKVVLWFFFMISSIEYDLQEQNLEKQVD